MASQGPNYPNNARDTADANNTSTFGWINQANLKANDSSYTTCSIQGPNFDASIYLIGSDFGFSIPAGATINGITFEFGRKCSPNSGDISTLLVGAVKSGNSVIDTRSDPTPDWTTTDFVTTIGGPADLWGDTWTPADINSSGFGVAVRCWNQGIGGGSPPWVASVNFFRVTVDYTPVVSGRSSVSSLFGF